MNLKPVLIVLLMFSSLCISAEFVGGPKEQYKITLTSRYGKEELTFNQNIYESYKIPVYPNTETLYKLIKDNDNIDIVFKDSADNGCSSVAIFNIVYKVRRYYNYQGTKKTFKTFESLDAPYDKTTIILLGPRSGAKENQITVTGNKIYVEGIMMEGERCVGLERAADKLILTALNIQLK